MCFRICLFLNKLCPLKAVGGFAWNPATNTQVVIEGWASSNSQEPSPEADHFSGCGAIGSTNMPSPDGGQPSACNASLLGVGFYLLIYMHGPLRTPVCRYPKDRSFNADPNLPSAARPSRPRFPHHSSNSDPDLNGLRLIVDSSHFSPQLAQRGIFSSLCRRLIHA